MFADGRVLLVFGTGKVGGAVVDQLALRYPQHRYVFVSRSSDQASKRANLTRYICSQWGSYPDVSHSAADLRDVGRTADLIRSVRPDVVFNATTMFPWWLLGKLPAPLPALNYKTGLGMWSALDCLLPLRLAEALEMAAVPTLYVNACYPDVVNAFLAHKARRPVTGIGNFSNVVPGLTLAFSRDLGVPAGSIRIQLTCNHYTGLTAPTLGSHAGLPYHLAVTHPDGVLTFTAPDDTPFVLLKKNFSRVRGLDGQPVTVMSAATVLASLLNGQRRRHHTPGPLGLPGGYPVEIGQDGRIELALPGGLDRDEAVRINLTGQLRDGVRIASEGRLSLTDAANEALKVITGARQPEVTEDNIDAVCDDLISRLTGKYDLELRV